MGIEEILEQAKALSREQRRELAQRLLASVDDDHTGQGETGAEIVAKIEALDGPIEFVDDHIEDPVEWVKTQRQKRIDYLSQYTKGNDNK